MNALVVFISPEVIAELLRLPAGIRVAGIETQDFGRRFRLLLVGDTLPRVEETMAWPEGLLLYRTDSPEAEVRVG